MGKAYGFTAYGNEENETWFEQPEPTPGPSELVIAVKAIGVNPVDFKLRNGYGADPGTAPEFPLVIGVEAAGVVTAVGADVDGFAQGDAVLGRAASSHGTYAEQAVLRADTCVHKPTQVSWVDAATLSVAGGTAWDALERIGLGEGTQEGQTLLVNGIGGGVGLLAAQIARDRGLAVFGVASASKRALAESLGATLVAYDEGDVVEQMRAILPGGVDAVLDVVGGDALRHVAILVTDPGRIVSVADPAVAELGGSHLVSTSVGVPAVAELVASGKLDPKVLQTYPFDDAAQALRSIESGHTLGQIVIELPS